ncbi:MAG: hypothetical protein INR71_00735 [Terriglobus roseus]|nr:hypothetical protein [Terriglobus roseus]
MFSPCPAPSHLRLLPPAPFVVPAVIEALRESGYRDVVRVVPGEADPYCAEDVRLHGGFVVTGDSDLLVYDLGQVGGVVFLQDFSLGTSPSSFHMLPFSYSSLSSRFWTIDDCYRRTPHSEVLPALKGGTRAPPGVFGQTGLCRVERARQEAWRIC